MTDHSSYIGKHLLAGLTYLDRDGNVVNKIQVHGIITRITDEGIFFMQPNDEDFSLPPDIEALQPAPPGNYRLRATGEVVVNPDYLCSWTINAPPSAGSDGQQVP